MKKLIFAIIFLSGISHADSTRGVLVNLPKNPNLKSQSQKEAPRPPIFNESQFSLWVSSWGPGSFSSITRVPSNSFEGNRIPELGADLRFAIRKRAFEPSLGVSIKGVNRETSSNSRSQYAWIFSTRAGLSQLFWIDHDFALRPQATLLPTYLLIQHAAQSETSNQFGLGAELGFDLQKKQIPWATLGAFYRFGQIGDCPLNGLGLRVGIQL